jgi:hypothetical protein
MVSCGSAECCETELMDSIGVVGTELRKMKWSKILSLAPMHL